MTQQIYCFFPNFQTKFGKSFEGIEKKDGNTPTPYTMEEKKNYLKAILSKARLAGLCTTQAEFAELIGVTKTTMSSAMQGREGYLNDRFMARVMQFAQEHGLDGDAAQPSDKRPDIVIPAETLELYTAMAKSIDRLSALVDRLAPGADAVPRAHAEFQKNFLPD